MKNGQENIFTFIESESTLKRFKKTIKETYQEIKTDPKKFATNLFSKESGKSRQYLHVGLAGAAFSWLFGAIIYTGVYFWQGEPKLDDSDNLQLIAKLVALPPSKPKLPTLKAANRASGGGGGGRKNEMTPPPGGRIPIAELKNPIVPPTTHPPEIKNPSLPIPPTINVQPELILKQDTSLPLGIPTNAPGIPSDGDGDGGGFGGGKGGGVGKGKGDGFGDGKNGNTGGGNNSSGSGDQIYSPSMGIKNPIITYKQKPLYTEDARRDKIQGQVILSVILREDGTITDIRVVRGLGYGLDEEAIRAASKIKFIPGTKDGQRVNVKVRLEFAFQLL